MSKLILTNEVTGLGTPGDVVDVKAGYARNYLIPQGFAVAWSRGAEKQIEQIKAARAAREHATLEEAQSFKAALEAATVKLTAKAAGKEGRLFGSITTSDIATAVEAAGLGSIDKKKVEIATPIKTTGAHEATVRLREDLVAVISLQVVAAK
ncbi:MAG: 50S ribosomal protein L9 [Microbacteriaceae bacterium]|nr:50S ribosomal protein L9 [Microbacteriaceae bacterium]